MVCIGLERKQTTWALDVGPQNRPPQTNKMSKNSFTAKLRLWHEMDMIKILLVHKMQNLRAQIGF